MKYRFAERITAIKNWVNSFLINMKLALNVDLKSTLVLIFSAFITGIAPVVLAITTGMVVGQFIPGSTASISKIIVIYTITYSMLQFGHIGVVSQRGWLAERITITMSKQIMKLPPKWIGIEHFENKEIYDKIETVDNLIGSMASVFFVQAITSTITCIGTFGLLWVIDWRIAILSSIIIIPLAIWQAKESRKSQIDIQRLSPNYRRINYLLELSTEIKTAKEIKLLNAEKFILDNYQKHSQSILKELSYIRLKEGIKSISGTIICGLSLGVICGLIVFWSIDSQLDPVKLAIFFVAIKEGQQAVGQLYSFMWAFSTLTVFFSTMIEMQKFEGLPQGTQNITEIESLSTNNISFTYQGRTRAALSDINISIKRGEILVIVGENGAGKSSLIKLFTRMYDPKEGTLNINGNDLKQFDTTSYRDLLGVSMQDVGRFPLTLKENIFFDKNDCMENVEEVFKKIDMETYVAKLPKGGDELVGRQWGGIEMSGGQWQKIGSARVFARPNANLLIMDEPNRFLDAHAEADLLDNIAKYIRNNNLSCIFITHRLGAARIGDRVLVMHDGKIVESGTHAELIKNQGKYSKLWNKQKEQYQLVD